MNKYNFTDCDNIRHFRVSKKIARDTYNAGETIILSPCKMIPRPRAMFDLSIAFSKELHPGYSFDSLCNEYAYYNCTNETGKYIAFYL